VFVEWECCFIEGHVVEFVEFFVVVVCCVGLDEVVEVEYFG